jgi:hypothetical protein
MASPLVLASAFAGRGDLATLLLPTAANLTGTFAEIK